MSARALVTFLASLLASFGVLYPCPGQSQPYPSKPIRIVVPFTAGGGNDLLARTIGERLNAAWGQPVLVDNRPGAAGNIGAELVARATPDGYTLLIAPNSVFTINPSLYDKVAFDPIKSFVPVSLLGAGPIVLVVNSAVPANSLKELIALAKSKPDGLSYASSGSGSPQHLSAELFKSMTAVKMVHVPYKGAAPAVTDLLGGQVQVLFAPMNTVLAHIKSGKLRALGVASDKRFAYLPDLPTIAEAGVPGYYSDTWFGLVTPAGTPKEVVDKLNREVGKILAQADVKEKLSAQGIEPSATTPAEFAALIKTDLARWDKVIRDSGARAE